MIYVPKRFEVELSSYCNAKCLACNRVNYIEDGTVWKNPNTVYNLNLDVDFLEDKIFSTPFFKDGTHFITVGNNGDALANPNVADIFEKAREYNPRIRLGLHTNGSLGKKETFERLAKLFSSGDDAFEFAIDGLEDTNEYYRVGVKWNKIIENVKTFVNAGGRPIWKFAPFKHNEDQIAEAKQLSKQLGFKRFRVIKNIMERPDNKSDSILNNFHAKGTQILDSYDNIPVSITKEKSPWIEKRSELLPQCTINNMIYVSSAKKVYPCCWFDSEWNMSIKNWWNGTWNDLNTYTLESIMQNKKVKELIDSFNNEQKVHRICQELCGSCKK